VQLLLGEHAAPNHRRFRLAQQWKDEYLQLKSGWSQQEGAGDGMGVSEAIMQLTEHMHLSSRARRSDALTAQDISNMVEAWEACSEMSPNKKDVVKVIDENGETTTRSKMFCYLRIKDVQQKLLDLHRQHRPESTLSVYRPGYIVEGKANTCLCETCEGIRFIKRATLTYAVQLRRPTVLIKAVYQITKFLIAVRMKSLLVAAHPERKAALTVEQRVTLFYVCAIRLKRVARLKERFPTVDIVSACKGGYKSDILTRLLCVGALPNWPVLSAADCGRPACVGHCDTADCCTSCIAAVLGPFKKLLLWSRVPAADKAWLARVLAGMQWQRAVAETEEWTEMEKVKYKKWGKEEYMTKDGAKERIMLTTHEVPTEQFVTYACEQLVSYADHVTTLRRQSFAAQQAIHNMQPHVVLLDIDFAENMEFRVRNASQSSYWKGLGSA
ncbi:hypothetical protein B484DRAFT_461238, partial [Ochromonadaceae sp. CCMP2298]